MRNIAIIPARGGSKRIPRKNIIDFMGRPMIAWTIEAALGSGLYERVLVSTDSEEIAEVSEAWGASVPFLRDAASDDQSPVSLATCAALRQCDEKIGERYETVTQLMANTPLRTARDIQKAMANFSAKDPPSQISCFRFGWMNPWWSSELDAAGRPTHLFPEAQTRRSQDLPPVYAPTGAIWIAKTAPLIEHRTFYMPGHVLQPLPWQSAVDIDDDDDLAMAKAVFLMRQAGQ